MQNFTKSQTRLAFVLYIFQCEFLNNNHRKTNEEFEKYFHDLDITAIGEEKKLNLKFNKNFFLKLSDNYINKFEHKDTIDRLNSYIEFNRKFEKWDNILKSIMFAIITELKITDKNKFKIVLNDYLNISKSLVSNKETKLINAIIQKYIDKYEINKK